MIAIAALRIYYDHWGNDEIKARRRQQGIQRLNATLLKFWSGSVADLIDLFDGGWVDEKEAVSFWKEISSVMLGDTPYTRRTPRRRVSENLRQPTTQLLYKLRIGPEKMREIDAIVALM